MRFCWKTADFMCLDRLHAAKGWWHWEAWIIKDAFDV